jgi:aconitate hydratase
VKGPNISSIPPLEPLSDDIKLPVLLVVGNNVSTDEILPAGARVLPFRSNIPKISRFAFEAIDPDYAHRAEQARAAGGHIVVGGQNYGQGSSREHAVLAPRFLGLRVVIAQSFARIHWQNLVNFGVLPLTFVDSGTWDGIARDDVLVIDRLYEQLATNSTVRVANNTKLNRFETQHQLSPRQLEVLRAGGLINWIKNSRGKSVHKPVGDKTR